MNANALMLLQELHRLDVDVTVRGLELKLKGRGQCLPSALRAELIRHKQELIQLLAPPVFFDLETRSKLDLRVVGGRTYATHPSTQILSCVFLVDDMLVVWVPDLHRHDGVRMQQKNILASVNYPPDLTKFHTDEDLPELLDQLIASGRPLCAHNAFGFDRLVWAAKGLPEPAEWLDTIPLARAGGYPGALDRLGERLLGRGKDDEGKKLVKQVCSPQQDGHFYELDTQDWATLVSYNVQDVLLLRDIYEQVRDYGERDVIAVDRRINERGIGFDVGLAGSLLKVAEEYQQRQTARLSTLTGGQVTPGDLNRIEYLKSWLRSRGCVLPNLRAETVEQFLTLQARVRAVDEAVLAVLEARLATASISGGKLKKGIAGVREDGRLRDQLIYHKCHTGRWAGCDVQLHSLPGARPAIKNPAALVTHTHGLEAFETALPEGVRVEDAVTALVRLCFVPSPQRVFCVADYASIEPRGTCWWAGEQGLLQRFAAGEDVYCAFASTLYNRPITKQDKTERAVGKVAVIGCGYNMGAERFAGYAQGFGVDLAGAGVTAEQVVESYRNAYPAIAGYLVEEQDRRWREGGLWQNVQHAAHAAVERGEGGVVGCCEFFRENSTLCVGLPSGRTIYYRNARLQYEDWGWGVSRKPNLVYDHPEKGPDKTYGGKLVENIVQAICRDLLAATLLTCEEEQLPVVLHVHDEVVIEAAAEQASESLTRFVEIMSTPPDWAAGLPIEVEGFATPRYVKSPLPGTACLRARNGVVLEQAQ